MDDVEMEISREWKTLDVDFDDKYDWRIEIDPEGDTCLVNELNGDNHHKIYEYKIEDDKIHYVIHDDPERGIEVIGKKNRYYIVSTTGERKMMNGFRYIKELLLQNHNFDMYESYEKLKANNINVYAVKSDAFHVAQKDVRKAKKVLDFGCEIGSWRVASNKVNCICQRYSCRHNEIPAIS